MILFQIILFAFINNVTSSESNDIFLSYENFLVEKLCFLSRETLDHYEIGLAVYIQEIHKKIIASKLKFRKPEFANINEERLSFKQHVKLKNNAIEDDAFELLYKLICIFKDELVEEDYFKLAKESKNDNIKCLDKEKFSFLYEKMNRELNNFFLKEIDFYKHDYQKTYLIIRISRQLQYFNEDILFSYEPLIKSINSFVLFYLIFKQSYYFDEIIKNSILNIAFIPFNFHNSKKVFLNATQFFNLNSSLLRIATETYYQKIIIDLSDQIKDLNSVLCNESFKCFEKVLFYNSIMLKTIIEMFEKDSIKNKKLSIKNLTRKVQMCRFFRVYLDDFMRKSCFYEIILLHIESNFNDFCFYTRDNDVLLMKKSIFVPLYHVKRQFYEHYKKSLDFLISFVELINNEKLKDFCEDLINGFLTCKKKFELIKLYFGLIEGIFDIVFFETFHDKIKGFISLKKSKNFIKKPKEIYLKDLESIFHKEIIDLKVQLKNFAEKQRKIYKVFGIMCIKNFKEWTGSIMNLQFLEFLKESNNKFYKGNYSHSEIFIIMKTKILMETEAFNLAISKSESKYVQDSTHFLKQEYTYEKYILACEKNLKALLRYYDEFNNHLLNFCIFIFKENTTLFTIATNEKNAIMFQLNKLIKNNYFSLKPETDSKFALLCKQHQSIIENQISYDLKLYKSIQAINIDLRTHIENIQVLNRPLHFKQAKPIKFDDLINQNFIFQILNFNEENGKEEQFYFKNLLKKCLCENYTLQEITSKIFEEIKTPNNIQNLYQLTRILQNNTYKTVLTFILDLKYLKKTLLDTTKGSETYAIPEYRKFLLSDQYRSDIIKVISMLYDRYTSFFNE